MSNVYFSDTVVHVQVQKFTPCDLNAYDLNNSCNFIHLKNVLLIMF